MELLSYWKLRFPFLYTIFFYAFDIYTLIGAVNMGPSNQSEAYFNSSSYLRLQTTISLKKQVGFSFRTCYGGILFSQQQNEDLVELAVYDDGIIFHVRTAGKTYDHRIRDNFLDNKWHTVYIQYTLGNLTIDVDGEVQLLANATYRNELLTSPGLYNEGAAVLLIGKQFNGCLLEGPAVVFDSNIIMSNHNVVFGPCPIPYDSCVPKEDVLGFDYCLTEPCMRHGTCLNGQQTYTCACLPRYTGKNCEIDLGNPCDRKTPVCKNSATCVPDISGDFTCICQPGFSGRRCEQEIKIDPRCKNNPCLNGGTCDVNQDDFVECKCKGGYNGTNCEINIDECAMIPCLHGGLCTDGLNNFTCDCSHTGYNGRKCEININECFSNPCLNQGTCFDTYGSYLCQCLPGFSGKNCQLNVDECVSQPCLNNGICSSRSGGFECRCRPGFLGTYCEIEQGQQRQCDPSSCPSHADCIDAEGLSVCVCKPEYPGEYPNCNLGSACANNPCLNGGLCSSFKGSYNCTCPSGFAGPACERAEHNTCCCCNDGHKCPRCGSVLTCANSPCQHAIACRDYLGGYFCTCEPGWTGLNCSTELGLCYVEQCRNAGTCYDHGGFFSCLCAPGFAGKKCQINIDECASNPCLNGGICMDKIDGFYCNCTGQWMGMICDKPYDICELKPCKNNGSCHSMSSKHEFICQCSSGFDGETCENNIDNCIGIKCRPEQVCVDLVDDYVCGCPPGYAGNDCSMETDPCAKEPCNNGTCIVDNNSHKFTCNCNPGYTGPLCSQDVNECTEFGDKICNGGICVNHEGGFQCYCKPGFTGVRCNVNVDECLSKPCQNNATCIDLINDYSCLCLDGYEGKNCSINIDECEPLPCSSGSTCIDGINEFTCVCQPGMSGKFCNINIDDCESSPCFNRGQCIDGLNSYTCDCSNTGYEGLHCENNIDDCKGDPCVNGAYCVDLIKDYQCKCYRGYTGKNCEIDIDECKDKPCQLDGLCLQKSNMTLYNPSIVSQLNITLPESFNRPFNYSSAFGYECLCVPGVTGPNCETNINECDSNPCRNGGTCTDKIGSYVCECDNGYEGEHCEVDINECEKYKPCIHGTCRDQIANYECDCEPGHGGKNCSVELTGCVANPCQNGGECRPFLVNEKQHRFNCSCPNGFHGLTCEMSTTMSLSGNSLVTVNTSRDEGYDIQFRFKTTLGDGLLALGKGLTYYILELSRGRLNLHSSLLNRWEGVFIGSNLNDSNWQKVFVAINSTHLVLSANDEQTIYPINYNENNVTSTSFPVTYIGGTPSNLRKLAHGQPSLVGCTEDVNINGEWVLPQMRNAPWLTFQNVDIGCLRQPQCDPNPCHSGGHCTDRWRDFSCTCERPYLGRTCQYNYTAATFGYENITNSLVTVGVADYARRAVRSIVDLSMFIKTRQPRGQIFYLGSGLLSNQQASSPDDTCISAQLESGELYVQIQFKGPSEGYTVGGVKLDNGYNHLIEVIRNVSLVQVKLNGTEYFRKTIAATGTLDAQVLYLGGQPQSRSVRQTNENMVATLKMDSTAPTAPAAVTSVFSYVPFKGIIQDVQISNGSSTMIVEFFPLQVQDLDIPPSFGNVSFEGSTVLEGIRSDNTCRVNPCYNDALCSITWNDYQCDCLKGYKGKDCNEWEFCEQEPRCPDGSTCKNLADGYECIANSTFNGLQAPLQYHLTVFRTSPNVIASNSLELTYRTRSWGTALFAKHSENYFVIFIYHNEVVVAWSFNGSANVPKRFRKDRFEGQWITLLFLTKEGKLKGGFKENVIDETYNFEEDFDSDIFTELFREGQIYVAGSDNKTFDFMTVIENTDYNMTGYIPISDTTTAESLISNSLEIGIDYLNEDVLLYKVDQGKKTDNFKGCLGEIRIGGLLLPYFPTKEISPNRTTRAEFFELDSSSTVEHGCILCYNTDCFNQGYCINNTETYKCNCQPGYAADDCSIDINECENNQCQNNATCIDKVAKYECECLAGYEGAHCEIDIDECLSNPCRHGGTCNDLIGTFKCDCPEDFVGKQCEAPLLITCENKPCREGATCKTGANEQTGNNFTCFCTTGMEGPLCDTPFCMRKHCEQGHCNTTGDVPYCQCQEGFKGTYCEINIDECVSPTGGSPCQNGGVCIDGIYRYDCNCSGTGYTGLLCEMDIDECKAEKPPCGLSGTCDNMRGSYRCICDSIKGKCGRQCDLDDPCEINNPCVHGTCNSQCTDKSDYICDCLEGYTGKNCTAPKVAASQSDGSLNILYIIIPIVLIILIAFAIGMAVVVNVARSKRATRGTYSPSAQEFCNPRVELDHVLKPPPEERLI